MASLIFPDRPKGMHWRRYDRLRRQHDQAVQDSIGTLAACAKRMLSRLTAKSSRRCLRLLSSRFRRRHRRNGRHRLPSSSSTPRRPSAPTEAGGARAWPLRLGVGVVVQVGVAVAMAVVVQVGWRLGWWLESRGLGWWELGVAAPSPSGSGHRGAGDTHADASLTSPRGLGLRAGACASTAALSSLRKRIDSALERGSKSGTCFADPLVPALRSTGSATDCLNCPDFVDR